MRHRAPTACKLMISGTISLPLQGFFSTFPHGTCALSVTREYLALARGQAGFIRGFTCPALLGIPLECAKSFVYGAITLFGRVFQLFLLPRRNLTLRSRNPDDASTVGLGSFPFARRYLGNLVSISFPRDTEMFHFSRYRFPTLWIQMRIPAHYGGRVAPFGDLRIKTCLRFPGAYRCLPRPSSPSRA